MEVRAWTQIAEVDSAQMMTWRVMRKSKAAHGGSMPVLSACLCLPVKKQICLSPVPSFEDKNQAMVF